VNITIVGAGISGLSAAFELQKSGFEVTLLEASERLGGKILTNEIEGFNIDAGPDSFLTRDPEMRELCFALGLGDELVSPTGKPAKVWVDGKMHSLPKRHFLGVPLDLDELEELSLLTKDGAIRAKLDLTLPDNEPKEGETVGSLIRRRFGDEVMDRLVGPLLGGINAGDADDLCLESGVPQLFNASQGDFSLVRSIQDFLKNQNRDPTSPVFLTHPDGLQKVVKRLEQEIDSNIRRNERVKSVEILDNSIVIKGSQEYQTDAVILCIPAFTAAKILHDSCPNTSNLLAGIQYASMAFITFAFNKADVPQFNGSGFLVGRDENLLTTACSLTSEKWAHLENDDTVFLRLSVGRFGDTDALDMEDNTLIERLKVELATLTGIKADPVATRVTRWPNSFPQYELGHGEKVSAIRQQAASEMPGMFLAGSPFKGIGLSACIRDGINQAREAKNFLMRR
tara:strand:- start:230 stop:1594 length:1365 start_codon:yes stop_codon:yes gene_type:complete